VHYPLIIIGAGLSGLAAGIRFARFGQKSLILEKHSVAGGLNSYYYRRGILLETGLHAMTNYAEPGNRHAPLNLLFRQLQLKRRSFRTHPQFSSEILFCDQASLRFSNDFGLLSAEIAASFPQAVDRFQTLVRLIDGYDPFALRPWLSTRRILNDLLAEPLLSDMLLCPLMFYGNSTEHDMDFSQFVIMFRSIFQEGFFRPAGTIKDFLDLLLAHYQEFGGDIRLRSGVDRLIIDDGRVRGVCLASGETITCDYLVSTIGYPGTLRLLGTADPETIKEAAGRLSFMEFLYLPTKEEAERIVDRRTIIFYNQGAKFEYCRPAEAVDTRSGVICFPHNFEGLPLEFPCQVRVTHMANYDLWKQASTSAYQEMKVDWGRRSRRVVGKIIGNSLESNLFEDSFTPLTIEKFSGKDQGAIYGSPMKIKDGRTTCPNLILAGTDQGYLGIVGAMLSGVSMVNQHILGKD